MKMYIGSDDGNGNRYVMLDGSKIVYQISDEVCKNYSESGIILDLLIDFD